MICLIITDPYAYENLLDRALAEAREQAGGLFVVFFLDAGEMKRTIEDLAEKGWLGSGSRRALLESMLGGFRALAEDVLAEAKRRGARAGVEVRTQLYEGAKDGLLTVLNARGCSKVLSDGVITGLAGPEEAEG